MTEIEPAIIEVLVHSQSDPDRGAAGVERFKRAAGVIERELEGREYLVGDKLTVADIVTGGVLALATLGQLTAEFPNVTAYLDRLAARPGYQRALSGTESILTPA